MRLVHVSDWHLGIQTCSQPRVRDHERVLAEITEIATGFAPNLIIHTGDVWHSARPAEADISRGISALAGLARIAPVVVIAGNHDPRELFSTFEILARLEAERHSAQARLHFVPRARRPENGGILEFSGDGDERIRLACVPYISPGQVVDPFAENPQGENQEWTGSYSDTVRDVELILGQGLVEGYSSARDILLFAAHLHLDGARWSERSGMRNVMLGPDYASLRDHLPPVSYAAFGHIHCPQEIPGGGGRYAGSPLQVDFGEEDEDKSIVLVEARPGRPARVRCAPLTSARRLHRLDGTLDELAGHAKRVRGGLVKVKVHLDEEVTGLHDLVLGRLGGDVELLEVIAVIAGRQPVRLASEVVDAEEEPPLHTLYADYLARHGTAHGDVDDAVQTFTALLSVQQSGQPWVIAEEVPVEGAITRADEALASDGGDDVLEEPA